MADTIYPCSMNFQMIFAKFCEVVKYQSSFLLKYSSEFQGSEKKYSGLSLAKKKQTENGQVGVISANPG